MKYSTLLWASLFVFLQIFSCNKNDDDVDYRAEMRDFVIGISEYCKSFRQDFAVIPQNGIELLTNDGESDGEPEYNYLNAINGNGQEDLFFGYFYDDQKTPDSESDYLMAFLNISKGSGNTILVTDYCSTQLNVDDSYQYNENNGYISFAADHRELDNIPFYPSEPNNSHSGNIDQLSEAKNFLYLLNSENFQTKTDFLQSLASSKYDAIIMDLFYKDGTMFSDSEIQTLRNKPQGGKRLLLCYMSIGEAEDYRYYWLSSWDNDKPDWIEKENPDWAGNYKVKYWYEGWQEIIFGNSTSYTKLIIDSGFDGVYLDIIDAYEYFE